MTWHNDCTHNFINYDELNAEAKLNCLTTYVYNICAYEHFDDLKDFIEMVAEGKDVKASDRREMFDKYITSFDGKNGKRIKDFITEKYLEKFDN